jgi:hypothetical protein
MRKVLNTKTGAETSSYFYPKEGDRVVGFNYVSFRIPPNWLDVDPPTVCVCVPNTHNNYKCINHNVTSTIFILHKFMLKIQNVIVCVCVCLCVRMLCYKI